MLTETDIRGLADGQSYSRGKEYYSAGMVRSLARRGDTLFAVVSGSAPLPYQVAVTFDRDELASATCTCPYDWGGYCKHIVAALLAAVHDPQAIEERRSVDELLADLEADALRGLLSSILASRPDLLNWVEAQLALQRPRLQTSTAGSTTRHAAPKIAVDVKAIRRLVRSAMAASGDYYETASVVASLDGVLRLAREAVEAGDGEAALAIIEVIADDTIPGWEEHDDSDGEFGDWFSSLGAVGTEALLTANLTSAERESWAAQLTTWEHELSDYGIDAAFGAAILAAQQGWDDPQLQQKLTGAFAVTEDVSEDGAEAKADYDEYDDSFADDLTAARLSVLERQGRIEEYLNLARVEGQAVPYAGMLVKLGRVEQAVDYGLHNLITYEEALALATVLQERGETRTALRIGEHGLTLKIGQPAALARWVRAAALDQGEAALALQAARVAFEAGATLADYKIVRSLAGDKWSTLKPALLAHLAGLQYAHERIDIFLYEGLIAEAIHTLDAHLYAGYGDIEKVANAAVQTHPDWVISRCRRQAEPIMDGAKSTQYPTALHWLDIVRRAYQASGRSQEWRKYCASLLATHARKYRLTPGLQELLTR